PPGDHDCRQVTTSRDACAARGRRRATTIPLVDNELKDDSQARARRHESCTATATPCDRGCRAFDRGAEHPAIIRSQSSMQSDMPQRVWICFRVALRALIGLGLIAGTGAALSAPIVRQVSGTLTHKGTITISGIGFGSKTNAAPVVWDDATASTLSAKWDGARSEERRVGKERRARGSPVFWQKK